MSRRVLIRYSVSEMSGGGGRLAGQLGLWRVWFAQALKRSLVCGGKHTYYLVGEYTVQHLPLLNLFFSPHLAGFLLLYVYLM